MNWQLIIGSGGLVGIAAIIFYLGRIVARFEIRFDKIETDLKEVKTEIKEIRKDLSVIGSRLDRLEVRVEERTLKHFSYPRETSQKASGVSQ